MPKASLTTWGAKIAARATIVMMVADTKKTIGLRGCLSGSLPSIALERDPMGVFGGEVLSAGGVCRGESAESPSGADSLVSGDRLTDLLRSSWGLSGCWNKGAGTPGRSNIRQDLGLGPGVGAS